jgi:hypothetical protein
MENHTEEPQSLGASPRPCSIPHSSPIEWLRYDAESEGVEPPPDADGPADALAGTADEPGLPSVISTCHGWTPFARRLFLEVLAETGRVSTACEYTRLTRQSAYALRARDPLFAASWDAACELARQPLADALYERAVDGVTDTITKDGEVVATRHRFDSRLSIAVLHRLDKRCDRAEERGSKHLALVARWDEWLALVGKGAEQEAAALLEPAQHCQKCQIPQSENPTALDSEEEEIDLSDRFWLDEDSTERVWMTDFPPPADFTLYQSCEYGDPDRIYKRECTPEEVETLEADIARGRAIERSEDEALRDEWFELLRAECSEAVLPTGSDAGDESPPLCADAPPPGADSSNDDAASPMPAAANPASAPGNSCSEGSAGTSCDGTGGSSGVTDASQPSCDALPAQRASPSSSHAARGDESRSPDDASPGRCFEAESAAAAGTAEAAPERPAALAEAAAASSGRGRSSGERAGHSSSVERTREKRGQRNLGPATETSNAS